MSVLRAARYIVPVYREFFPIWRYRSPKWFPHPGWFPDWFEDRTFATREEAEAFVGSFK